MAHKPGTKAHGSEACATARQAEPELSQVERFGDNKRLQTQVRYWGAYTLNS